MPEAERQHPTGGDFTEVPLNRSSGTRLQLLSNDATQRVLELRHLPVEVLPQRRVDERLVPGRAPGFFRHSKEAIHDILVQPNRDSSLALGLRFGWKHSASLSFAEVVSVFHRPASYSARSWASAVLAEMIRIFSPRQVYTTTSNRSGRTHAERDEPLFSWVQLIVRDRNCERVVKDRNRLRHTDTVLTEIDPGFPIFVPLKTHVLSVSTVRTYVNCPRIRVAYTNMPDPNEPTSNNSKEKSESDVLRRKGRSPKRTRPRKKGSSSPHTDRRSY